MVEMNSSDADIDGAVVRRLRTAILQSRHLTQKCLLADVHRRRTRLIEKEKGGMKVVGLGSLSARP